MVILEKYSNYKDIVSVVEFDSRGTQICYFVLTKSLQETKEQWFSLLVYVADIDCHFILVANILILFVERP